MEEYKDVFIFLMVMIVLLILWMFIKLFLQELKNDDRLNKISKKYHDNEFFF